jgi:hypothetical protein
MEGGRDGFYLEAVFVVVKNQNSPCFDSKPEATAIQREQQ